MKKFSVTILLLIGVLFIVDAQQEFSNFSFYGKNSLNNNQNFFEIREAYQNGKYNNYQISVEEFEKWEYFWKHRINPDGSFPEQGYLWNNIKEAKNKRVNNLRRGDWKCIGPRNIKLNGSWTPGVGRINVIMEDPKNPNILYAGGPSGGLWRSKNDGKSWTPLTDHLSFIGVSAIAIDHKNSNIIYIATGDDDGQITPGIGVWCSKDNGINWEQTGKNGNIEGIGSEILIDPDNSNNLWVATTKGVFYSSDGAQHWHKALGIGEGVNDLKLMPNNSGVVYAADGKSFFRSDDGGRAFDKVEISFPLESKRISIGVTPANPNYVYVLGAHLGNQYNGIFRSDDSGVTFKEMNTNKPRFDSGKPSYALSIAISDTDPEEVYRGCKNIYKSKKGGEGLKKITNWSNYYSDAYVHGNIHFIKVMNGRVYVGTDGGAYRSEDGGESFECLSANGIITGQFIKITGHPYFEDVLVAGLLDNGGYFRDGEVWNNFFGNSGIGVGVSRVNKNKRFGLIPNGVGFYGSIDGTPGKAMASLPGGGTWATPLEEMKDGSFLSGGEYIFQYNYEENHWKKLGDQKFENKLDVIEVAPSDKNVIYVADDRKFYSSINGGNSWIEGSLPNKDFISSIEVHDKNPFVIWATARGRVFKSTDAGKTWINISEGLLQVAINRIKKAKGELEELYLATDAGVMYRNKEMPAWETFNNGMANVMVMDLSLNDHAGMIRAATFGRGVWESEMGPHVDVQNQDNIELNFELYPNPVVENLNINVRTNNPGNYQLEVWSILGQKVEEFSLGYIHKFFKDKVDFNHPSGVYILKLKKGKLEYLKKIVKN